MSKSCKVLTLGFNDTDMAFYFNNPMTKEARSSTIYIAPTSQAKAFMSAWYELCLKEMAKGIAIPYGDQSIMITLLRQFSLQIGDLPLAYTVIFDRDLITRDQITILHFQASRTAAMDRIFWENLSGNYTAVGLKL